MPLFQFKNELTNFLREYIYVLAEMFEPSRIILATCIQATFSYKNIDADHIVEIFPIDTLLFFIYNCLRENGVSLSHRCIRENEEVI